jgi:HEAT repeat protein
VSKSSIPVSCRELDLAAVEAELVKHHCNVAAAARALGVPASDLRRLVTWGPLAAAVSEQVEQAIDRAEAVLRDGLSSPDALVRLKAASALLTLSPAGRRRGFGRGASAGRQTRPPEDVTLKWRDS